jgi:CheY-like chemotaxis protein
MLMATVLVVDDSADAREIIGLTLQRAGFDVLQAGSGSEALRVMAQRPDVVVLDLRLPDIDGYEVCRRIKAEPRTAAVPVVAITAFYFAAEERHEALKAGVDGLITKPADQTQLSTLITRLLQERRSA